MLSLIVESLISFGFITRGAATVNCGSGAVIMCLPPVPGGQRAKIKDYPLHRVTVHSSQPPLVYAEKALGEVFGNWPVRITFADNLALWAAQKNKLLSCEGQGKGRVIPLVTIFGRGGGVFMCTVCVLIDTYFVSSLHLQEE